MRVVAKVSDPPTLSATDLARIQHESRRLHDAFTVRTASMEMLTTEDLKVRVKLRVTQPTPRAIGDG